MIPFRICNEEELQVGSDFYVFLNSLQIITDYVEEVVFVNDHSLESAVLLLKSFLRSNWKVISLDKEFEGKKMALYSGIREARTEYIWTLDADVEIRNWKSDLFEKFLNQLNQDLVILPVEMKNGNSLLQSLQFNEWRYMQFLTNFSSRLRLPMMCNGANLVFKRSVFLKHVQKHQSVSSGDDMFLLSEVLRDNGAVGWCKYHYGDVYISSESSFKGAFIQRVRWSGKTMRLPFSKSSYLQFLFALLSALHVLCFAGFFMDSIRTVSISFLIVKVILESTGIVFNAKSGYPLKNLIWLPIQLSIYPFFSLIIFITSLFFVPKWKNRRVSLS